MINPVTFKPAWYLSNRHLQTILPNIIHPAFSAGKEQRIFLSDGDFLDLHWSRRRSTKTLLILHGLEGSIRSAYAKRIMNYCNHQGIAAVLMHFRGCSGEPNKRLRSYHSGDTDDLREVIQRLKAEGVTDIALLGYSLGGNVTLKYMGETETDESIRCAIAVSVPFRLDICATVMNRGFAKIYQKTLLDRLIEKMRAKQHLFEADNRLFPDPGTMTSFWEFDDCFTAPLHGFGSAEHYYRSASSRQFLNGINKPTLIVHAEDDPFMSPAVLPEPDELSASITFELTQKGGHVGFVSNRGFLPDMWLQRRIHRFLIEQHFLEGNNLPE